MNTPRRVSRIVHDDCLSELKKIPSDYVDLLVTDPPYGYSFMNRDWDKAVPSVEIWKECLRVLKPGAFAFIMSAPRSDVLSRMIVRIEDAGFRVDFSPIYWSYASGFPKAMNIGKMVDKRFGYEREVIAMRKTKSARKMNGGNYLNQQNMQVVEELPVTEPATPEAKALDGSYGGFQPKPAVEVIIVAMRPLSEKTFVDQALKNGKGITWLDDCRVPSEPYTINNYQEAGNPFDDKGEGKYEGKESIGRFPANLLVSDDVLNDGKHRHTAGNRQQKESANSTFGANNGTKVRDLYQDSGSYSRYFDLDAWWAQTLPFLIVPKASKGEKDEGLNAFEEKRVMGGGGTYNEEAGRKFGAIKSAKRNSHPTVKPLKLMSYLITLGSREGDLVLDPFLGSGTTALASHMLNRQYIGIEREEEYVKIAEARLKSVSNQPKLFTA